ncbi:MAG: UDP-N-acetylmuramate--L-alanine ligase [Candidatus Obscuribacterales bacterium]|nr:UDP-N-acetylmuramate--L-alanine ligase [Candidatus Obscuribacterales bacterium]
MELNTSRTMDTVQSSSTQAGTESGKESLSRLAGPVHFVGVGGIGMSALARLLLAEGIEVSGSDKAASPITEELQALGAEIFIGHKAENVARAESLVLSTAISSENPELKLAKERNLPVYHRSEILRYLAEKKKAIAVSGTHGKTTTTGMIAQMMLAAGYDPSVVVGGVFAYMNSNAHAGKGEFFVAEADESDRSHAQLSSQIAVVTNIEADHMENYPGGMEQILVTMASFANRARQCIVLCKDDPGCMQLLPLLEKKVVSYGQAEDADYSMKLDADGLQFQVFKKGNLLGPVEMKVPGLHNKMNALASIAVCMESGMSFAQAAEAISAFKGVARRFEHIGESHGVLVVDDYGHHPTEVKATLEAARQFKKNSGRKGRTVAVFQPHQPGRLRDLWNEFCLAFENADLVLLADIYVARGGQIEGISSERFCRELNHKNAHYLCGATKELPAKIKAHLLNGDLVLTIGAGDITSVGKPLLELIENEGLDGRID